MKLFLPQNIFAEIFLSAVNSVKEIKSEFTPSALLAKKLSDEPGSIALIPTLDLINHKELFISSEIGISFDGPISNSMIYFKHGDEDLGELMLSGDVSTNEVILSKIIFKELYNLNVSVSLNSSGEISSDKNFIVTGSENFQKNRFLNGITLAEEVTELINAPYVNFVLASASEENIKEFVNTYKNDLGNTEALNFVSIFKDQSQQAMEFIVSNIQHLIFTFDEQDIEGIKLLLELPYFHGIIKEMIDIKFVS